MLLRRKVVLHDRIGVITPTISNSISIDDAVILRCRHINLTICVVVVKHSFTKCWRNFRPTIYRYQLTTSFKSRVPNRYNLFRQFDVLQFKALPKCITTDLDNCRGDINAFQVITSAIHCKCRHPNRCYRSIKSHNTLISSFIERMVKKCGIYFGVVRLHLFGCSIGNDTDQGRFCIRHDAIGIIYPSIFVGLNCGCRHIDFTPGW